MDVIKMDMNKNNFNPLTPESDTQNILLCLMPDYFTRQWPGRGGGPRLFEVWIG